MKKSGRKIRRLLTGNGKILLLRGDCLRKLKLLPDNCVDSVVTDPPAGISFMGKDWDTFNKVPSGFKGASPANLNSKNPFFHQKGQTISSSLLARDNFVHFMTRVMKQCIRVLKPGGYVLAWALPRTSHWTATAIEKAGFEVRDVIAHVFGSGMPKSLDVSKAIDKMKGKERRVIGRRKHPTLRDVNKIEEQAGAVHGGNSWSREWDITAPSTEEAKRWSGWGTGLKPAREDWILARKPIEGTVANNVLKYSTGAINIDGCRVSLDPSVDDARLGGKGSWSGGKIGYGSRGKEGKETTSSPLGRWPANLIHDGSKEVIRNFPVTSSGAMKREVGSYEGESVTGFLRGRSGPNNQHGDSGSASRFFYCSKASKRERGVGNNHPCVKSIALMRYLCKLVTPPGGLILDPFMGSGSTGIAVVKSKNKNWRFLGIERDKGYFKIAKIRIIASRKKIRKAKGILRKMKPLFG